MTIELHRAGDLLEIRLARPPVNALVPALLDALATAVRQAPADGAREPSLAAIDESGTGENTPASGWIGWRC